MSIELGKTYVTELNTKWRVASVTGLKGTEVIVVNDDLGKIRCLDLQGQGPGGVPVLVQEFDIWSEVAIDTPIWVKDHPAEEWIPRHFAKRSGGYVMAWSNGTTSHSAPTADPTTRWEMATLVKPT